MLKQNYVELQKNKKVRLNGIDLNHIIKEQFQNVLKSETDHLLQRSEKYKHTMEFRLCLLLVSTYSKSFPSLLFSYALIFKIRVIKKHSTLHDVMLCSLKTFNVNLTLNVFKLHSITP